MKSSSATRSGGLLSLLTVFVLLFFLLGYGVTEELGVGSLKGRLTSPITGGPLKNVAVVLRPTAIDEDWDLKVRTVRTNEQGDYAFSSIGEGAYVLSAFGKTMSIERKPVQVIEGRTEVQDFVLECEVPYLNIDMAQHVFTPDEEPVVQVRGSSRETKLDLKVWKVPYQAIADGASLYSLSGLIQRGDSKTPESDGRLKKITETTRDIRQRDGEGIFVDRLGLGKLPEGIYLISVLMEERPQVTYAIVSKIALVTKVADDEALGFVTDLRTGKPIPGAQVDMVMAFQKREMDKTDANGLVSKKIPNPISDMEMMARVGNSVAFSRAPVTQPSAGANLEFFVHTDRPVYRPGDTVNYRAILRQRTPDGFRLPDAKEVDVTVYDPDENVVQKGRVSIDQHGVYSGEFQSLTDATGSYRIESQIGERRNTEWVEIASYRKPEMTLKITPLQPLYVRGTTIKMKVKAEYYFGGPVVGARLAGWAESVPLYTWSNDETGESEEYSYESGNFLGELPNAVTDDKGEAILEFELPKDEKEDPRREASRQDERVTFNVMATEQGDKYIEGKGQAKLVQGDFNLKIEQSDDFAQPGKPLEIKAIVLSHDSKPLANIATEIEIGYEQWDRPTGRSYFVPVEKKTVTSNSEGLVMTTITPERAGELRVRLRATDSGGRKISAGTWYWCWDGSSDVSMGPSTSLEVKLDRKSYKVGDQATILIRSNVRNASALVTIEADGILQKQVVPLRGELTSLKMPVDARMSPNAFVAVCLVSDKQFFETSRRLVVKNDAQEIKINVTSDKQVYEPGEDVIYSIQTTNAEGQPVRAQIGLGVVDESVYAIREDSSDPVGTFYQTRYNNVITNYSFEDIYLDGGEKGPANIEIREDFRDTAYWNPRISTDANGQAKVTVKLPDNLTTWRATAIGATDNSAFGKSKSNVISRKPLMVRLSAPSYWVQDDVIRVTATVNNGTSMEQKVEVRLDAADLTFKQGEKSQTVQVPAEGKALVEWSLKAVGFGDRDLTVTANSGQYNDGMRLTLPIQALGRPVERFWGGDVAGEKTFEIVRLPGAEEGSVKLSISPSLAPAIFSSLGDLIDYPYGCVEQTMSRFMPAVVAGKAIRDLNLQEPALLERVPDVARKSIRRLRTMQHSDGGFGWWENDTSDMGMSALVLEGLWRSETAGFATDPSMRDRLLEYCLGALNTPVADPTWTDNPDTKKWWREQVTRDKSCLAASIAFYSNKDVARNWILNVDVKQLSEAEIGQLVIGASRMVKRNPNDSAIAKQRDKLLKDLKARAQTSGSVVSFNEVWGYESAARALQALVEVNPSDPMIPGIIRGLFGTRRGSSWMSTRDTGMIVVGLAGYLQSQAPSVQPGTVDVLVNGELVQTIPINQGDGEVRETKIDWPIAKLQDGTNRIQLRVSGQARTWFALHSRQVPYQPEIGKLNNASDLEITRTFHALSPRRMENGERRLMPDDNPITQVASGQALRVRLVIKAKSRHEFVMIEVPTPANFRVTENTQPETWDWWWSSMSVFDNRVVLFARTIEEGERVIEYNIRAETPGTATALPARIFEMYDPEEEGSSASVRVEVSR